MQLTRRFQPRIPPCGRFICSAQTSFVSCFPAVKSQVLLGFVAVSFGFFLKTRISPPLFSNQESGVRKTCAVAEPCRVIVVPLWRVGCCPAGISGCHLATPGLQTIQSQSEQAPRFASSPRGNFSPCCDLVWQPVVRTQQGCSARPLMAPPLQEHVLPSSWPGLLRCC